MSKTKPNFLKKIKRKFLNLKRKIFHSDKPLKEVDIFDRHIFADEISQKIELEHGKHESSFIFGISGYWGEGKSFLLSLLEKRLKGKKYSVVWFNPWKFAGDRPTLMRRFIQLINKELPFYLRFNLTELERDQTILSLNILWILIVGCCVVVGYLLFVYLQIFNSFVSLHKGLVATLITLIIIPLLIKLITIQHTTEKAETVDRFDDFLKKILVRIKFLRKRMVIFIDDLDRTTPLVANEVLDTLRTFFDTPHLSYVVTGDHRTLEKFIGKRLLETEQTKDANSGDEGRRFLKKIFNVYWRMPLPTETQMLKFINEKLKEVELTDVDKSTLIGWLIRFFEMNPRNIERFIEMLDFNLKTLKLRRE